MLIELYKLLRIQFENITIERDKTTNFVNVKMMIHCNEKFVSLKITTLKCCNTK
jgi:hypothetical protein